MAKLCISAQVVIIWTQWNILLQIIWNSITCPPLFLVLFVVTYVLPEMLSKYTDTGSIKNNFNANFDFSRARWFGTFKMIRIEGDDKQGYKWQCLDCNFSFPYTTSVKRHIKSKHVGSVLYECDICRHRVPTKNALNFHKVRNHNPAISFYNQLFMVVFMKIWII